MTCARWLIGGMLAASLTLGGCGVRGGLEQSEEAKAANQADKTASKQSTEAAKAGQTAAPAAHKPFVLDGLIR